MIIRRKYVVCEPLLLKEYAQNHLTYVDQQKFTRNIKYTHFIIFIEFNINL